ncbi:hypothetical protein IW262DRAFT_1464171 [Armillaria fumosa]|nr:hypothetical protein IW262DRAFT_1464171 [Armillaria fumosa]
MARVQVFIVKKYATLRLTGRRMGYSRPTSIPGKKRSDGWDRLTGDERWSSRTVWIVSNGDGCAVKLPSSQSGWFWTETMNFYPPSSVQERDVVLESSGLENTPLLRAVKGRFTLLRLRRRIRRRWEGLKVEGVLLAGSMKTRTRARIRTRATLTARGFPSNARSQMPPARIAYHPRRPFLPAEVPARRLSLPRRTSVSWCRDHGRCRMALRLQARAMARQTRDIVLDLARVKTGDDGGRRRIVGEEGNDGDTLGEDGRWGVDGVRDRR